MPTVKLAPPARQQFEDSNGAPYAGAKLFTYAAGSSTKQATYTDNTGTAANTNPIILDAAGRTPFGLWLQSGLNYKFVLAPSTDTDPPTSPIFTEDVITGINDTTTPAALATSAQWVASGLTPTYVNATQFTLTGDERAAFHAGRRLRLTVTAGTVYGEISVSAFTTLTTVTVILDSGTLDSGLSVVDVGILTAQNISMPEPSSVGYQPLDTLLTNLAAQTTAANRIQGYSGADTPLLYTVGNAVGNIPAVTATSTASETVAGLVEKATSGEMTAGAGDKYPDAALVASYLDSLFTGSNQSLAASGYQKLPGGLIVQWGGQSVAAATTVTVSFPLTFPTACLRFIAGTGIDGGAGINRNDSTGGTFISTSQFQLRQGSGSSAITINWIAIGY